MSNFVEASQILGTGPGMTVERTVQPFANIGPPLWAGKP